MVGETDVDKAVCLVAKLENESVDGMVVGWADDEEVRRVVMKGDKGVVEKVFELVCQMAE